MLRTRQYRTGTEVLVGLSSGILGLASVALSLLWLHAEWRPTAAVVLAATGAVLLAFTLLPGVPSLRRGRLGDIAETACLLGLLPLLVLAAAGGAGQERGHQAATAERVRLDEVLLGRHGRARLGPDGGVDAGRQDEQRQQP